MNMNISAISRNIGIALLANAVFMFISAGVSALNDFDAAFVPLVISGIITFAAGSFPLLFVKNNENLSVKEGFTIIVLAWLLSCIFAMLPYLMWGGEFTLVNAFFESVSGLTTTGASILTDVEALPKGLLFWRSSTHFIGGLGVVVFILLVLPEISTFRFKLAKIEMSELSKNDYRFRSRNKVYVILGVYLSLVLANTLALWACGMSFYDAVNHAFSTISTGGFSTHNASLAYFNSIPVEIVTIFFMTISAIHFGMLYLLFVKGSLKIFRASIVRYYLGCIAVCTVLVAANLLLSGHVPNWGRAVRDALFNVTSVVSTTGFVTVDTDKWPAFAILILIFLSFQCGLAGSTTGGIKADRVWLMFCALKRQIKQLLHPNAVVSVKVGGVTISQSVLYPTALFVVLYLITTLISTLVLTLLNLNIEDAFTGTLACLSNVGPGFGSVGAVCNFNHIPAMGKLVLSVDMLLGRVEIYPVLMLLSGIFKGGRR